jgi:hypothetical protein
MELEQRRAIKFLHTKGLKLDKIAPELCSTDGWDAHTFLSIKYLLHQIKLGRTDLQMQHVGERLTFDEIDPEILSVLQKFPFSSVQTIADSLAIPVSTIHIYLLEKIGLKWFQFIAFPAH